jgi:hypothetical protein
VLFELLDDELEVLTLEELDDEEDVEIELLEELVLTELDELEVLILEDELEELELELVEVVTCAITEKEHEVIEPVLV